MGEDIEKKAKELRKKALEAQKELKLLKQMQSDEQILEKRDDLAKKLRKPTPMENFVKALGQGSQNVMDSFGKEYQTIKKSKKK